MILSALLFTACGYTGCMFQHSLIEWWTYKDKYMSVGDDLLKAVITGVLSFAFSVLGFVTYG